MMKSFSLATHEIFTEINKTLSNTYAQDYHPLKIQISNRNPREFPSNGHPLIQLSVGILTEIEIRFGKLWNKRSLGCDHDNAEWQSGVSLVMRACTATLSLPLSHHML